MKGSMLAVILTVAGLAGGQVGAVDWSGYGIKDTEQGAIAGDPDAQFLLARHYDRRYSNEATRWYQLAAEQGYRDAQYEMARRYHVGSGVPQDDSQSVAWLNKAADLGHTEAQYAMAVRYFNGTGVPQDYLHARYWCMKAAENGVDEARLLMARFYLEALGVERDEAEGVAWVAEAAVQKGKTARQAQAMLGSLFQRGVGVERDLKMAYVWYSVAAANGDGGAPISRDLVAKGLSADELDEAQALAGQYFERFNTKS